MNLTTPLANFTQTSYEYSVLAFLSRNACRRIHALQDVIIERFGEDNLWIPRNEQLHITFADIISPDVTYSEDAAPLFSRLRSDVYTVLEKITPQNLRIPLAFSSIKVHPSAIIIKAQDDGSFARLRHAFTNALSLPEQTHKPPNIIHSSIVRFRTQLNVDELQAFVDKECIGLLPFTEVIDRLKVIEGTGLFVRNHKTLATFPQPTA